MGNSIFQTKIGGVAMKQYHVWGGLHSFEVVSIWFEMPPPSRVQSRWITLNHAGITRESRPPPPRSFLGVFWGPNHAQSRPITPTKNPEICLFLVIFDWFSTHFRGFSRIFLFFGFFHQFSRVWGNNTPNFDGCPCMWSKMSIYMAYSGEWPCLIHSYKVYFFRNPQLEPVPKHPIKTSNP